MPAPGSGLLAIAIERYLDSERTLASIPSPFKELHRAGRCDYWGAAYNIRVSRTRGLRDTDRRL